jgi:hypothetical protein
MTIAGQVLLTVAVVLATASAGAWMFGVFHLVMHQVRVLQAKPTLRQALSGQLRPEASEVHRRLFNKAGFTFLALVVIAMLVGLIGAAWSSGR